MTATDALKWVKVLPSERTALMLGFAFHFCVLASYYLVRPLRDASVSYTHLTLPTILLV